MSVWSIEIRDERERLICGLALHAGLEAGQRIIIYRVEVKLSQLHCR